MLLGWFKNILIKYLPRNILQFLVEKKKIYFEKNYAKKILKNIEKKRINSVIVIYDNCCSPPTFGDFFFVMMLARFFVSHDIFVKYFIIDGEYREDWKLLSAKEKAELIETNMKAAQLFLPADKAEIKITSIASIAKNNYINLKQDGYILFEELVTLRKPIYKHALNTLNFLCAHSSIKKINSFLLSANDLEFNKHINIPDKPYITWNCRYSNKWETHRNTIDSEFLLVHNALSKLYPHHAIMIISDLAGCDYFRSLAKVNNFDCLFSKDFSDSLIGDGFLILNSHYFYVLRGGGITVFPLFSKIPYKVVFKGSNEVEWRRGKATSWATENQIFRLPGRDQDVFPSN